MAVKPKKTGTSRSRLDDEVAQEERGSNTAIRRRRLVPQPVPFIVYPFVRDADLAQVIRSLPGFDPFRDAGTTWVFDAERAWSAIEWIETNWVITEGDGAGQAIKMPMWQRAVVANVWGWVHHETGMRRFREAFVYVPRGNAKSFLCSAMIGLGLYHETEAGRKVFGLASKFEQACVVFNYVAGAVNANEALGERCKVFGASAGAQQKSIQMVDDFQSVYKVLPYNPESSDGLRPFMVVSDELHTHPDMGMVDRLRRGMGTRSQPLFIHITTADYEREGSPCNIIHDYAKSVIAGNGDARFLPVLYEAPRDCDWHSPEVWKSVNPNYGVTVTAASLQIEHDRASSIPSEENNFKRFHLNIRTSQAHKPIPIEKWDACREDFTMESLEGAPCYGGVDIASTKDLTAFALFFPASGTVLTWFWCAAEGAEEREHRDRVPYVTWARQGYIALTPGSRFEQAYAFDHIVACASRFGVIDIAYDPAMAANLAQQLTQQGINMVLFRQGAYSFNAPSKEFERRIATRELRHDGNPVMRMCVDNLSFEANKQDNMMPTKQNDRCRIDGAVAAIMAIGRAMANWVPSSQEDFSFI